MKYIILLLLIIGCGTRKVENVKRDSISINNSYSNGSKIVLSSDITFEPVDSLKPFKIEGKEYYNVKIKDSKSKVIEKWKTRNITKTIVVEKTKLSKKKDDTILFIGLFAVLIAGIIIYLKIK